MALFHPPVGTHNSTRPQRVVPATLVVLFVLLALGLGLGVGITFGQRGAASGTVTGTHGAVPSYLSKDVDFSLFWKVWDHIHQSYLEQPVSDTKLFYGALDGMVGALGDPYSVFMNPDIAKKFGDELEGSFEGIGAEIGIRDGNLVVIAPLPDTPAARAGLQPGDRIIGIDGADTTGMAVDYAVNLIRGLHGTKVKLDVLASGQKEPREVTITRARILIQVVQGKMKDLPQGKGSVAYLKVVHFSSDVDQKFREAWTELAAKGPKGIIIDLRNNPGGFLDQAVDLASHWIGSGVVVKEGQTAAAARPYLSTGRGELKDFPTIVLVNQGSASASEIFAGALQDTGLASIVGEQTFGKGTVQNLEDYPGGSEVKLTIAKWFTPKGRSINKNGITPDIVVKLTPKDADAGKDPQLDRALELLAR